MSSCLHIKYIFNEFIICCYNYFQHTHHRRRFHFNHNHNNNNLTPAYAGLDIRRTIAPHVATRVAVQAAAVRVAAIVLGIDDRAVREVGIDEGTTRVCMRR